MPNVVQGRLIRQSSSQLLRVIENETRGELYCRTAWCSGSTGLCNILIGAAVMTSIIYVFHDGDYHVAYYTVAVSIKLKYLVCGTPSHLRHSLGSTQCQALHLALVND